MIIPVMNIRKNRNNDSENDKDNDGKLAVVALDWLTDITLSECLDKRFLIFFDGTPISNQQASLATPE